jgi:hypothetical protein
MTAYTIKGTVRAKGEDILVKDMYFGEMKTQSGIIIGNDDAKGHGVKPRWAQVYDVGPDQKLISPEQWILVEHGRWTRKIRVEKDGVETELQKIDPDGILGVFSGEGKPDFNYIGQEFGDGESFTVNPEDFM